MAERFPAITIWQPWATMIAEGLKPYEFRGWALPRHIVDKRIAIHAGARPVRKAEVQELLLRLRTDGAFGQALDVPGSIALLERVLTSPGMLPLSSILCLATARRSLTPAEVGRQLANDSGRGEHFNHAWPLTEIERLTPFVPARGAQGFWTWEMAHG